MRVLMVGAHPDDCDFRGAGLALAVIERGGAVKFLSLTDGSCGHQSMQKAQLAKRRLDECKDVERISGIEYDVWDVSDGELTSSIANRERLICEIRKYKPDIVITHRRNDYHPDHRSTAYLVQDAAYMLIVPNICEDVPPLDKMPVMLYFADNFSHPHFCADIVVGIDRYMDKKYEIMSCHQSQVYEWLPFTEGRLNEVPKGKAERLEWLKSPRYDAEIIKEMLKKKMVYSFGECRQAVERIKFSKQLSKKYGKASKNIKYCEAFEISEYSGITDIKQVQELLPF